MRSLKEIVPLLFWVKALCSYVLVLAEGKITTCQCGQTNPMSSGLRIVGREEAMVQEFPYMVAILVLRTKSMDWTRNCAGSIITKRHVLTAAHCTTFPKSNLRVIVGEQVIDKHYKMELTKGIKISGVCKHPMYKKLPNNATGNDIALLTTNEEIKFNNEVGPICLPTEPVNLVGKSLRVAGWGWTNLRGLQSNTLMKMDVDVIPITNCSNAFPKSIDTENPTQLCTYGKDKFTLKGDSGSPLAWFDAQAKRYVQAGLVSYGSYEVPHKYPSVETDVFAFMPWIQEQISMSTFCNGTTEQSRSIVGDDH